MDAGARAAFLDVKPILARIAMAAPRLGFTEPDLPCLGQSRSGGQPGALMLCANVGQHLFWDPVRASFIALTLLLHSCNVWT